VPLCVLLERAGLEEDVCEIVLEGPNSQEYLSKPLDFAAKMLLSRGTKLSDLWLPVRINGDIALFKGLMKEMLAEEDRRPGEILDWDFIRRYTVGYGGLGENERSVSRSARRAIERCKARCGPSPGSSSRGSKGRKSPALGNAVTDATLEGYLQPMTLLPWCWENQSS
jgi:hypothetical protein